MMAKIQEVKPRRMSAEDLRWRAESDVSTMKRMMEIQKDTPRMKMANDMLHKELKDLASLTGTQIITRKNFSNSKVNKTTKKGGK